MSLANPPIDPTLDPVTGLPTDASYFSQYQIPLASQPINLNELDAQGKQSTWLYPDHLPPVVARLQARDLTNEGNAQDLSTNGKRDLNVNIASSDVPLAPTSNPTPAKYNNFTAPTIGTLCANNSRVYFDDVSTASVIYGVTYWAALDPNSTPVLRDVFYTITIAPQTGPGTGLIIGMGGWSIVPSGITADLKGDNVTLLFPVPINRALTWPGLNNVLISLAASGGDIFCGGAAIVG